MKKSCEEEREMDERKQVTDSSSKRIENNFFPSTCDLSSSLTEETMLCLTIDTKSQSRSSTGVLERECLPHTYK